ncbi:hypothetical protein HMPREF3188_00156 [Tissierellia bacterium KA00581]|nr:hypothetical protein HMPREF3188_00156 [Tissierellia bacterium KA00581]
MYTERGEQQMSKKKEKSKAEKVKDFDKKSDNIIKLALVTALINLLIAILEIITKLIDWVWAKK